MKCTNCNFMNPDGAKYCSNCGNKLEEMKCCSNSNCENYNKFVIPLDSKFCPKCGTNIEVKNEAPFHVRYPEYDLVPYSEFRYKNDIFSNLFDMLFTQTPDYIEDCNRYEGVNYFFIVKNEKIGILRYMYHKHWYGDDHITKKIIPCEYDRIERSNNDDFFICYKGDSKVYLDNNGERLK